MQWLFLFFALECGFLPEQPDAFLHDDAFYTQFEAEVMIFSLIFVGGSTRCVFSPIAGSYQFQPQIMEYLFRAGIRYGPIEVGFRRKCDHRREYLGGLGVHEEFYLRLSSPPRIQPGN